MSEFTGCTRSHPHENMNDECKFKTETARTINKLANEVAAAKQEKLELLAVIESVKGILQDYGMYEAADLLLAEPSQALREHEAKVLAPESKRLDFVLDNLCFIQSKKTDSGADSYQLMSQNEDEEFFTLHNPDAFFKSPREAINASILMAEERRKK